jgi:hypothetical protein
MWPMAKMALDKPPQNTPTTGHPPSERVQFRTNVLIQRAAHPAGRAHISVAGK